MSDWDYIIIGAGSAGCVVADQLTASGQHRVLLLEAGVSDRSWLISVPLAGLQFGLSRFDWGYESAPDPTRNGRSEQWSRGRVVGGTSSINGMNYVRGSACDYDRWARLGNHGWAASDVMPLFRELECCDRRSIHPSNGIRGRDGRLHVRAVREPHPVTEAFIEAARAAGHAFTRDYNGAAQEGIGCAQLSQRGRRRWSAADAFLGPASRRKNLQLITEAHAHRLVIKERRVSGVLYERGGRLHEARARHLILCAGAINTPQLLMLSGVGDADTLRQHGIEVALDRPAVGQNLLEHPLVRLVYRTRVPTCNLTEGPLQKLRFLARYVARGQGPLSCVFESLAFLKTDAQEPEPDVQLHFAAFGYDTVGEGDRPVVKMLPYPSITVLVNKNYPVSRGRIVLVSSDPRAAPRIEPRLLESAADTETLARGIALVRRIVAAAPLQPWVSEEIRPGQACASAVSLRNFVRDQTQIAYHPAGTCRMGVDEEAVVTPNQQVRGLENLWIADASIMPDLISGNTNAACMMIGLKLGRYLREQAR